MDYQRWHESEIARLANLWPAASYEVIRQSFPNRPLSSIARYARFREIKRHRSAKRTHLFKIDPLIFELRQIREHRGMTRNELAKNLGIHATQLARWELGQHSPRLKDLRRWTLALHCEIRVSIKMR